MNWIRLPIVALESILEIYSLWQGRSFPRDLAFLRELWLSSAHMTHTRDAKFFGDSGTRIHCISCLVESSMEDQQSRQEIN